MTQEYGLSRLPGGRISFRACSARVRLYCFHLELLEAEFQGFPEFLLVFLGRDLGLQNEGRSLVLLQCESELDLARSVSLGELEHFHTVKNSGRVDDVRKKQTWRQLHEGAKKTIVGYICGARHARSYNHPHSMHASCREDGHSAD